MARRSARPLRAAPPPPVAARRQPDAAGDAPAVFAGSLRPAGRRRATAPASRGPRLGRHRRVPGRDRRGRRGPRDLPRVVAADASARVPVLGPARNRGRGAHRQGPRRRRQGAGAAPAGDLAAVVGRLPCVAGGHDPPGVDHRRRHDGGDRQLLQGAGAGRPGAQPSGCWRRFRPASAVDGGYGSTAGISCFSASSMRPRNVSAACPSGTST